MGLLRLRFGRPERRRPVLLVEGCCAEAVGVSVARFFCFSEHLRGREDACCELAEGGVIVVVSVSLAFGCFCARL